ncbi:MAG TPA: response regulator [Myxococcaceae bacterium]|nr:response regulator [Myxococcaceae bacterium]
MSTILLVDDEPELLELYAEVLELMEHRVLRAHDGREALDIAHERHPDLVVTDFQMPRMSGVELCQRLVQDEELQDIPVIMHSAARDPHAPGVQTFLSKFCELDEFEEVVSRALCGGRQPPEHSPPPAMCASSWTGSWEQGSACCM